MIGDSLTVGNFGKTFAQAFTAANPGIPFLQESAWGSSPQDWQSDTSTFAAIGIASRDGKTESVQDPTRRNVALQLWQNSFGHPTYPTPKLAALIEKHQASHLVVALGTNMLFALQSGGQSQTVTHGIQNLVREAKEHGIRHIDWIGPPALKRFHADSIALFYSLLTRSTDPRFVTVWDSRLWIEKYPPNPNWARYDDGLHFFHPAGFRATRTWAQSAARAISSNRRGEFALDGLMIHTYGSPRDPALVFVHGGPGYDSQDFEWSMADTLAQEGYYVIVYDQRGQGRSAPALSPDDYHYHKYADDLAELIGRLKLKKPTLLAHSHGGPIALRFDQKFPNLAERIVLISAPVNFWKTMQSIHENCDARFLAKEKITERAQLDAAFTVLEQSHPTFETQIQAIGTAFALGMQESCGLYQVAHPIPEALQLKTRIRQWHQPVPSENQIYPMGNFVINENYHRLDHSPWVTGHADHIFGIYGDEDGLFTPSVLAEIASNLRGNPRPERFQLIPGASHAVYVDQPKLFIRALNRIFQKP